MKARFRFLIIIFSIVGTTLACSFAGGDQADLQATSQFIGNAVVATSTIVAQNVTDPNAPAQ